jgi:hypothetical protein
MMVFVVYQQNIDNDSEGISSLILIKGAIMI